MKTIGKKLNPIHQLHRDILQLSQKYPNHYTLIITSTDRPDDQKSNHSIAGFAVDFLISNDLSIQTKPDYRTTWLFALELFKIGYAIGFYPADQRFHVHIDGRKDRRAFVLDPDKNLYYSLEKNDKEFFTALDKISQMANFNISEHFRRTIYNLPNNQKNFKPFNITNNNLIFYIALTGFIFYFFIQRNNKIRKKK